MDTVFILFIAFLYIVICTTAVCVYLGYYVGMSQLFVKAGEKPWKAIIPFYSDYTMFKLTWKKMWFWIYVALEVIFIISVVTIYICALITPSNSSASDIFITTVIITCILGALFLGLFYAYMYHIAKAYSDEPVGMTFGLIFLTKIFYMILGFGHYEYKYKLVKENE